MYVICIETCWCKQTIVQIPGLNILRVMREAEAVAEGMKASKVSDETLVDLTMEKATLKGQCSCRTILDFTKKTDEEDQN